MTATTPDTLVNAVLYPIAEIKVHKRLRAANAAKVQALAESIREQGLLQPIGLTEGGDLIYGLHRYEAVKLLKHSMIEALLITPESREHLELAEIDENLIRAELTELEQATQLARRKQLYEKIHGKSHGGDRRSKSQAETLKSSPSFVEDTAQQTGISKPTVHRKVALGTALADVAERITDTPVADNQAELQALAKLPSDEREAVVSLLEAGEVDTVKEAQQALKKHQRAKAEKLAEGSAAASEAVKVSQGEWWRLGRHLLYCGDTSCYAQPYDYPEYAKQRVWYETISPQDRPNIHEATLAFADPPYNAGVAEWDHSFEWQHDYISDLARFAVVTPGTSGLFDFAKRTKMPYRWLIECYIDNGMTKGALGFQTHIPAPLFSHEASVHRNSQDLCKVSISNAETDETEHKGRKPMGFLVWLLQTFTERGDLVIDPFAGSGQTLLACEALERTCITGELSPLFCEQIISRWQDKTGLKAERVI